MKEAMRKGLVSLVTGAAMVASPLAFAAQDTSGMQYTSAAEGFYASIRARYNSGGDEVDGADIQNGSSRIGVRGTNDLGGGLSGFYQYELGVGIDNGSDTSTRLGHVGLRGNFGEVVVGTFWDQTYNWVHGSTDIANTHSGQFNYTNLLPGRQSNAIQYTTPDLNGFQAALRAGMKNERENVYTGIIQRDPELATVMLQDEDDRNSFIQAAIDDGDITDGNDDDVFESVRGKEKEDGNDLDNWALSAKYSIQGFDVAGMYSVIPDGAYKATEGDNQADGSNITLSVTSEDMSAYAFKLGYAQDNWYVNAWYAQYDDEGTGIETKIPVISSKNQPGLNADETGFAVEEVAVVSDKEVYVVERTQDTEIFSIAAGVSVDKVNVYGLYETKDYFMATDDKIGEGEDTHAAVGVQYNLGSNSRVWIEYASQDLDSDKSAEDYVNIGLRHDF